MYLPDLLPGADEASASGFGETTVSSGLKWGLYFDKQSGTETWRISYSRMRIERL